MSPESEGASKTSKPTSGYQNMSSSRFCPFAAGPGYKRYVIAWLASLGLLCVLAMRCEIGIAMIKLTQPELEKVLAKNQTGASSDSPKYERKWHHEVSWSQQTIGIIEAAFFAGYMIFSLPAGLLATIYPANKCLGVSVLITCCVNLVVPPIIHFSSHWLPVVLARVVQGVAEGGLYPCVHAIFRYWAPVSERSKLVTICFFGMALGPIIGYPLSGFVMDYFGWASAFYIYGIAGCVWAIIWLFVSSERPSQDKRISEEEREYIESNNSPAAVHMRDVPWGRILSSVPVWAIIVGNIGRNWTFQFSVSGLPSYYADVFHYPVEAIGIQMSLPYITMAIMTPVCGQLADWLIRNSSLGVKNVRKVFNTIGFGVTAICLFLVAFVPYLWMATLLITLALGFMGVGLSGYAVNHLDIAPAYAGILMGLSNGLGTLSGIIAPVMAGTLTIKHNHNGWRNFFLVSSGIHIVCVIFYAIFAKGEPQNWAQHEKLGDNQETNASYGTILLETEQKIE